MTNKRTLSVRISNTRTTATAPMIESPERDRPLKGQPISQKEKYLLYCSDKALVKATPHRESKSTTVILDVHVSVALADVDSNIHS